MLLLLFSFLFVCKLLFTFNLSFAGMNLSNGLVLLGNGLGHKLGGP